MAEIHIKIKNLPEIKRAFGKSPILMTRELNAAIRKVVYKIEPDSKRATPVDTGRLRSSTYTRFNNLKGELGTNTLYDMYVHDGTRFMPARPYLRNAVESNEHNTDKYFTDAVDNVLRQIAREVG
jgi:HK97 gp10 family phage protein